MFQLNISLHNHQVLNISILITYIEYLILFIFIRYSVLAFVRYAMLMGLVHGSSESLISTLLCTEMDLSNDDSSLFLHQILCLKRSLLSSLMVSFILSGVLCIRVVLISFALYQYAMLMGLVEVVTV